MKKRLCRLFLNKQKKYLMLFAALLIVSGIYVNYHFMTYASFYYNWQSLFTFDENWYWYSDESKKHNEIEDYLLTEHDAISAHEYRCKNYRYVDGEEFGWDKVDYGVFFQATDKEITNLREKFTDYMRILSVPDIVKEKWRTVSENGAVSVLVLVVIWGITVSGGVFWFRKALEQSREEQEYLLFVGFSPRVIRACYGRCFWSYFLLAFFVSFVPRILAVFPDMFHYIFTDFEFWRIYPCIPCGMFLFYFITFILLYHWSKKIWNKEYGGEAPEQEKRHRFIRDLTLEDNLILILLAQDYSERAAENLVGRMVSEEKISFCAKHKMETCPAEEKQIFFRLQDKLLADLI